MERRSRPDEEVKEQGEPDSPYFTILVPETSNNLGFLAMK